MTSSLNFCFTMKLDKIEEFSFNSLTVLNFDVKYLQLFYNLWWCKYSLNLDSLAYLSSIYSLQLMVILLMAYYLAIILCFWPSYSVFLCKMAIILNLSRNSLNFFIFSILFIIFYFEKSEITCKWLIILCFRSVFIF